MIQVSKYDTCTIHFLHRDASQDRHVYKQNRYCMTGVSLDMCKIKIYILLHLSNRDTCTLHLFRLNTCLKCHRCKINFVHYLSLDIAFVHSSTCLYGYVSNWNLFCITGLHMHTCVRCKLAQCATSADRHMSQNNLYRSQLLKKGMGQRNVGTSAYVSTWIYFRRKVVQYS